jgi:uncharacterized membrane protein YgcG
VPVPQGFVTDTAGVIDAATKAKMTRLLEELQQRDRRRDRRADRRQHRAAR